MKILYYLFIFVITFAGCCKKKLKIDSKFLKGKKLEYEQLLAQHNEIPDIHIGFEVDSIVQNSIDSNSLEIIYKPIKKLNITIEDIKVSYIADMEMLGWQCIGEFSGSATQLIFQKAGRKLLSTLEIESNLQIRIIIYTKR
ncbi:hypothetical protein HYV10_04080 [Candidatus Dependentiae bacterium]|nr:hypothetical protein [Candidatus Dependentiae bacterium]